MKSDCLLDLQLPHRTGFLGLAILVFVRFISGLGVMMWGVGWALSRGARGLVKELGVFWGLFGLRKL